MVISVGDESLCKISSIKRCFIILLASPLIVGVLFFMLKTQIQVDVFHGVVKNEDIRNDQSYDVERTTSIIEISSTSQEILPPERGLSDEGSNVVDEEKKVITPANNTETTAVILLTYMRSGSSLTGDILQKSPDTFYIFEPLRSADFANREKKTVRYINGSYLLHGQYDLQHVYEETLYGWLTCDLSRVHAQSFFDIGFLPYAHNFHDYLRCIRGAKYGNLMTRNALYESKQFMDCLKELEQTCKSSKVKIVKTIRTHGAIAQSIFKSIPNSKILHLIRDPRATMESKRHRNVCHEGMTLCIAEHCDRVRKDSLVLQNLKSSEPNRISTVFYEDIASNPIVTAKDMYSFIGTNFTEKIASYVYNITLGMDTTGCKVCVQRWQNGKKAKSSETHIAAWKSGLPGTYINQTQVLCKDIIKNYGYEFYMAPPALKPSKSQQMLGRRKKAIRRRV
ncbi:Carbohydrate sulfotransferase 1 [Mactra antiquata]